MKRFFAIISAGAAFAVFAAEATYRNPVIWADVPDTALCSDGTNVYMVSTTMHLQPGAPVMKSSDMILADDRVIERVDSIEKQSVEIKGNIVYLRVQADFRAGRDVAKFSWSTNGKDWREIGEEVPLYFDWTRFFMGTKFALFCYSTKTPGGHADFDFFKYSSTGHEKDKR